MEGFDSQLRAFDGNVMVLAYCFLLLGGVALYIFPSTMSVWDEWLIEKYHITPVMETVPMQWMSEPYRIAIQYLYPGLLIWTLLNLIHAICLSIDTFLERRNIKRYYSSWRGF